MKKLISISTFLLLIIAVTACCDQVLDEATGIDGEESVATRAIAFKATDYYLYRGKKDSSPKNRREVSRGVPF
jgi:hypothetical protein